MLGKLKAELGELKSYSPGQRFTCFYERHHDRQAGWVRPLMWSAVIVSLAIGVVLAFIPGPAILFFAIAAALLATQSRGVAKRLDKVEVGTRKLLQSLRDKRQRAKREAKASGAHRRQARS
ncbi:MAG TPA: hypothetical protein VJR89_23155 [Polyangiales bacterium]|nr:hypothetical protein [Polyangiales bacterium]